jgi:hypothetical protein
MDIQTKKKTISIVCFFCHDNQQESRAVTKNVGLYLPKQVFCHGQLYVALSRVTNKNGLKVLTCEDEDSDSNMTKNIVYKEIFLN